MKDSVRERLARLEAMHEESAQLHKETRDEIKSFRHDLFGVINPLLTDVAGLKTDIHWVKKQKVWNPVLKIGSVTGLAGLVIELINHFLKKGP